MPSLGFFSFCWFVLSNFDVITFALSYKAKLYKAKNKVVLFLNALMKETKERREKMKKRKKGGMEGEERRDGIKKPSH